MVYEGLPRHCERHLPVQVCSWLLIQTNAVDGTLAL